MRHPLDLSFGYRLLSPLFDHQGHGRQRRWDQDAIVTGVRDLRGRKTATGTLRGSR